MRLHENKERFLDAITATSATFGFEPALIEKDYYVTLFLKEAAQRISGLVFKGGTSLSKCYKLIDRFSEDVDLTLDEEHFTEKGKRGSVKGLISVCDTVGLVLLNKKEIELHTHGNYNQLRIQYPITFASDVVKPELVVEMAYIQRPYPTEKRLANSYIGDFFERRGNRQIVSEYGLEPFYVQAQSLQRTLVDKVFAICDYYLSDKPERNSRHIYDISRLLTEVDIYDDAFRHLVNNVRAERKKNKTCLSAQEGIDVSAILSDIVKTGFFKKDYNATTLKLLTKSISYENATKSLQIIIDSKAFLSLR